MSDDAIKQFSSLSPPDRRAIERHLTQAERLALHALVTNRGAPTTAAPKLDFSPFSPWLAKPLIRIATEASGQAVTPATRVAVRTLIEGAARKTAP